MEKVTVAAEVPKEVHELLDNLAEIVLRLAKPLSDGLGLDDVDDFAAVLPQLWEAVSGVDNVLDEIKGDPTGVAVSAALMVDKILDRWPNA